MMKRKFLAVVLPIIGCATVVGSGFSAWYFGNNVAIGNYSGSTPVNVDVTDELKDATGTLSVDTTASTITGKTLILDQGGLKNNSLDSGIMFGEASAIKTKDTNGNKWDFTVSYNKDAGEGDKLTLGELYDAGLRIRINLSIEIKGDLVKYITFQDSVPTVTVAPSGLTGTDDPVTLTGERTSPIRSADYIITEEQVNRSETTASWKFELGVDTKKKENGDYSNALLKYLPPVYNGPGNTYNGGKPSAKGEPLSMKTDLTNDGEDATKIVFSVTAFIEDDPDNLTNN